MESTFRGKERTVKNKMREITSMMAATVTGRGRHEVDTMKIRRKETRVTIAAEARELHPGKARERDFIRVLF